MTTDLERELGDADLDVRIAALIRIKAEPAEALSDGELDALVGCLGSPSKAVQRRASDALVARAGHDCRVIRAVRALLASDVAQTRWGAAYTLGTIGGNALDLGALDALLEALDADDGDLRWASAERIVELGRKHRERVCAALIALGRAGGNIARKMALYCLRDLGAASDEVRMLAECAAADGNIHLRLAALSLLGRLGDPSGRAAETVTRCLEGDSDPGVRRSAAATLGLLGNHSPRVISALRLAAADAGDESLRRSAAQALKRLGES
jgi:HEAT repeat protein